MEEGRALRLRIGYENMFRAIGKFCDERKLDEVCLLEFERGIILQGLLLESTGEGWKRRLISETWSYEQIAAMPQVGPAPGPAVGKKPSR